MAIGTVAGRNRSHLFLVRFERIHPRAVGFVADLGQAGRQPRIEDDKQLMRERRRGWALEPRGQVLGAISSSPLRAALRKPSTLPLGVSRPSGSGGGATGAGAAAAGAVVVGVWARVPAAHRNARISPAPTARTTP